MKTKCLFALLSVALLLTCCSSPSPSAPEEPKLEKIELLSGPDITSYFVGDLFDPTGVSITATYSDEKSEVVEYDTNKEAFTFSPSLSTPLRVEDTKVTLTYEKLTLDIAISVEVEVIPTEVSFTINDIDSLCIHTELQESYAKCTDPDKFFQDNLSSENYFGKRSISAPKGIEVSYTINENGHARGKYSVVTSEDSEFSSSYTHKGEKNHTTVQNLKINTEYYYYVKAEYGSSVFRSETKSFTTENTTIRNIAAEGVENVRDLGGYVTEDGKTVKQEMIYRTAQFNYDHSSSSAIVSEPTEKGKEVLLNQLKIKTEIDVREKQKSNGDDETAGITSSPLGSSVNYVNLPMKYGGSNVIANEANKASFKLFLEYCADEDNYPIAFHCVRGTDRTGAMAYAIGALCGVSELDLMKDYLFSNFANINSAYLESKAITGAAFYIEQIRNSEGDTLSEKTKNYLISKTGVSLETLNSIISILVG